MTALSLQERETLLEVARTSIQHGLSTGEPLTVDPKIYPSSLQQRRALFITLKCEARLRGCIGALVAHRPLICDAAYHAHAAAFSDPRFPRLARAEYDTVSVHISLLTPGEPIAFKSEADLLARLRPGVDGLVLEHGGLRGTFLPAVWESLPQPADFLAALKRKAGIPAEVCPTEASRYTTESFGDGDLG